MMKKKHNCFSLYDHINYKKQTKSFLASSFIVIIHEFLVLLEVKTSYLFTPHLYLTSGSV